MVRLVTDESGIEFISRLDSWQTWRKITHNFDSIRRLTGRQTGLISGSEMIAATGESVCPFCGGGKALQDVNLGKMFCLCYLLDFQIEIAGRLRPYQTPIDTNMAPLSALKPRSKDLSEAIGVMQRFIDNPQGWITLLGGVGTGKTHMLTYTARMLYPMALYLSADDLEQKLYEAMSDNTVPEMIDAISRAPILLLDDLGIEYGAAFVAAKLRAIINRRYGLWQEFPTVVASNLSLVKLKEHDARISSRITDFEKCTVISLHKLSDYRTDPTVRTNGRVK
jgi:hypothetical protein